jgi:SAM-dependent methyltransferase
VLKTDLFDEATAAGLYRQLAARASSVVGIDLSPVIVAAARARHEGLDATVADLRRLPFDAGAFDLVVSLSTLDHFGSRADLLAAVCELRRVLAPGGQLIVTLDNPSNPLVALRNALPFGVVNRLGLVPYYVGATCNRRSLEHVLAEVGFDVVETAAVMHCPRVLAVPVTRFVERRCSTAARKQWLALLLAFETLAGLPTRWRTGHFVAASAFAR